MAMPRKDPSAYNPITYAERAQFYETEHATEMDAAFLARFLEAAPAHVLEVPCGVGRNVLRIAQQGFKVTGVDLESAMVTRLAQRLDQPDLAHLKPLVKVRQADMRSLQLSSTFDLIIVPIDAFQLLLTDEDALAALRSLAGCLTPRGSLLIDLARFERHGVSEKSRPIYYDPAAPDGHPIHEWDRRLPSGGALTRYRIQHHDDTVMRFRFLYEKTETQGEQFLYTDLKLRRYANGSFKDLIQQAQLQIVESFGDHDFGPLTPSSARVIYRLARPAYG